MARQELTEMVEDRSVQALENKDKIVCTCTTCKGKETLAFAGGVL